MTGLRAGQPRNRGSIPGRARDFVFSKTPIPAPGATEPVIQCVLADLSLGVKRPGREADRSPKSNRFIYKCHRLEHNLF
jgi:hypothetical protein